MDWAIFLFIGAGFLAGLIVGVDLAGRKWTLNADVPMRMEWKGRVYKVVHAK